MSENNNCSDQKRHNSGPDPLRPFPSDLLQLRDHAVRPLGLVHASRHEEDLPGRSVSWQKSTESYFKFFNCHPWFGQLIMMATLAVESTKDEHCHRDRAGCPYLLDGPPGRPGRRHRLGAAARPYWAPSPDIRHRTAACSALILAVAVNIALWLAVLETGMARSTRQGVTFITEPQRPA